MLITRAGPAERVGVIAHVDSAAGKVMISDKIIRLKTKPSIMSKFLATWLSTEYVQGYFSRTLSGLAMSQTNISQNILQKALCVVPPIDEQKAITSAIGSVEQTLESKNIKLRINKQLKKALMQDLLTGKVRVTPDPE